MNKVKIIHTADLHLDNGFIAGDFPYKIIEERQRDLLDTFDKIIEMVRKEKVQLLLFSGDLFERRYIQLETVDYVNRKFASLDNTYVFILPGNHDPYHMVYHYKSFPWSNNVYVFSDEYQKIPIQELNVVVHGIGFGSQEEKRPILESLQCNESKEINILMLHGSDMTLAPKKESNYIPFNYLDLVNSGFDYIALGHYHQHKFYENNLGNTIASYPGSPEPLGFDELGKHGIIIGEITKEKNTVEMIAIGRRQYFTENINITNCIDLQEIREKILSSIASFRPENNLFLIRLTGYYSWEVGVSIDFVERQCKDLAYYIKLQDDTELSYDTDRLLGENTLASSYILQIQSKIQQETDHKQKNILKKALKIGIEALRGGGYRT